MMIVLTFWHLPWCVCVSSFPSYHRINWPRWITWGCRCPCLHLQTSSRWVCSRFATLQNCFQSSYRWRWTLTPVWKWHYNTWYARICLSLDPFHYWFPIWWHHNNRLVTRLTYMKSSLITLKISMQIKSQTNLRLSNIFNNNSSSNNNLIFPQDREFKLRGM